MINQQNISEFKKLYNGAVNEGKELFIFNGSEVLTDYAKYVIEYFDSIWNNKFAPVAQLDRASAF